MPPREDNAWFACAVALMLTAMGILMVASSLEENDAYDEGGHLVAGYARLRLGEYGFNTEHPPLGNALSALPLLPLNPRLATEHPSWRQSAAPIAGALFLYRNRVRPETLLFLGRLPTMLLTLALGVVIALWARARFGPAAAALATFFYAADPSFLAHGHYITTDVIAALFIFTACIGWEKYLVTRNWKHALTAGVLLGLALLSKFSTLFLLPIFAIVYLLHRPREKARLAAALALAGVIAAVIVGSGYWPETRRALSGELPLDRHSYLVGLRLVAEHSRDGHPAYLLGRVSEKGWWYYFPVVFAVKTPSAVLLLALAAIPAGIVAAVRRRKRLLQTFVSVEPKWLILTVPPAAYFAMSVASSINIGVRHLLPVYPFLHVLLAAVLFRARAAAPRKAFAAILLAVVVLQTAETANAHPDYLAFFNTLSGASARGDRYLVDSNLDWGQAVKKLRGYMDAHSIDSVCLAYFGTTDVAYWGLRPRKLPLTWELDQRRNMNCVAAVSATLLHDVYVQSGSYAWLREREPFARVGNSIYLYEIASGRLSRTAPSGRP
ncbi:MAG: glycosyltransferase family 39 protein [Bryobacteraceae bacterium]|nr:glycosyltransferase family 39 protein [Bryobacteraceae bacterium]